MLLIVAKLRAVMPLVFAVAGVIARSDCRGGGWDQSQCARHVETSSAERPSSLNKCADGGFVPMPRWSAVKFRAKSMRPHQFRLLHATVRWPFLNTASGWAISRPPCSGDWRVDDDDRRPGFYPLTPE